MFVQFREQLQKLIHLNNGWLIRYIHANGASMFFIVVYSHIARGLYYGSYMAPRELLWCSGVIIFLLMMGTAFTGAWVRGVKKVFLFIYLKHIVLNHYCNQCSESLLWRCLGILKFQIMNNLNFKKVTKFILIFKTFINGLKTFVDVRLKFNKVFIFLKINLLIQNWFNTCFIVDNYTKFVQSIYFFTLTYTFNNLIMILIIVNREIKKKMLLHQSAHLNKKLALNLSYFLGIYKKISCFIHV